MKVSLENKQANKNKGSVIGYKMRNQRNTLQTVFPGVYELTATKYITKKKRKNREIDRI